MKDFQNKGYDVMFLLLKRSNIDLCSCNSNTNELKRKMDQPNRKAVKNLTMVIMDGGHLKNS